jgi:hypothetical protein
MTKEIFITNSFEHNLKSLLGRIAGSETAAPAIKSLASEVFKELLVILKEDEPTLNGISVADILKLSKEEKQALLNKYLSMKQ